MSFQSSKGDELFSIISIQTCNIVKEYCAFRINKRCYHNNMRNKLLTRLGPNGLWIEKER